MKIFALIAGTMVAIAILIFKVTAVMISASECYRALPGSLGILCAFLGFPHEILFFGPRDSDAKVQYGGAYREPLCCCSDSRTESFRGLSKAS